MCGIAGYLLARTEHIDIARLTRVLHTGIDPRGGDATGAAWIDPFGTTHHYTVIGQARQFRTAHPNAAHNARVAILHTRFATQGPVSDHLNNHPVRSGHFLAVHNGHIYNDDEIFGTIDVPRYGEVDSEAAVALIRHANMHQQDVSKALERLEGRAALAWIDDRDPNTLHLARGSASPLVVAQTADGSFIFASTKGALNAAMNAVNLTPTWEYEVKEGEYLRLHNGMLAEVRTFKPNPGTRTWGKDQGVYTAPKYSWADESFVLGKRHRRGTYRPYPQDIYDHAWGRSLHSVPLSDERDTDDLHTMLATSEDMTEEQWLDYLEATEAKGRAFAAGVNGTVEEVDWHWDDQDLYHTAIKAAGIGE